MFLDLSFSYCLSTEKKGVMEVEHFQLRWIAVVLFLALGFSLILCWCLALLRR